MIRRKPRSGGATRDEAVELTIKRLFDVVGGLVGVVVLCPVLVCLAVIVRLESSGPALFRQERLGQKGNVFRIFKFRTMVVGARDGAVVPGDARLTRIGPFLRRWSLDELPQLLNVVRGEMSIVGPRPDRTFRLEEYTEHERRRLLMRPGITGLAQVNGRNSLGWEKRNAYDVEYVERWSLWLDFMILVKTVFVVLGRRGIDLDT